MKKFFLPLTLLVTTPLLFLSACLDPIQFEDPELNDNSLIVDGVFTTGKQVHSLRLSSPSLLSTGVIFPVENAEVSLFDESGNQFQYQSQGDGLYQLAETTPRGEVGKAYHIEIQLIDGKRYQSKPQIMPPLVKADRVYFNFEKEERLTTNGTVIKKTVLNVFIDTPLPPTDGSIQLRWFVDEVYSFPETFCIAPTKTCYIYQVTDLQSILIQSTEGTSATRFDQRKLVTKRNLKSMEFRGKHYFSAFQFSITREAFDYWENLQEVTQAAGTIFDPPPAKVRGNVLNVENPDETVLGFFEVASVDTVRSFISPGQFKDAFNNLVPYCPEPGFPFGGTIRLECCDCLRIRDASLERPAWF
jgi:Domain of unknown function (DUF4249)